MKALFVVFLMGISLSASAIGHPHNLFSAHRKAKKVKTTAVCRTLPQASVKRSLTATVRAAGPGAFAFGWEMLKKKML
ncbi:hypothetical protein [Tellurirhabdus rosea]|uniref:hypothetical protein n=1 Tax=Tellurirhabdus rosea TaxID=2674997 RepID=UPI00224F6AB6|nr:hypothetical protein [Tellurirhabdus rosea]